MKKLLLAIIILTFAVFSAACSSSSSNSNSNSNTSEKSEEGKPVKVKIGISGADERVWNFIAEKAKKEGIDIKIVRFSDYVQPNMALAEGEIDANAFQTVAYFDTFIKEHKLDLTPIGTTIIAPMGIYSDKYKKVDEIPDGGKIAVPNEASNMGRALLLLQEAGLIKLKDDFDGLGAVDKIAENPKNLEIVPVVPAQTPRVLPDVAASIINNGIAVDAGFSPTQDSIFHESATATPYINIIATRMENKDNPTLKKIVELFQSDDVAEYINKEFKGNQIPTFVPLSKIGW